MKLIIKMFLLIVCITGLFGSVVASAISKDTLQELIDNKKIEEIVQKETSYELKVKLSEEFKKTIIIPIDDKESIDLLSKAYNINSLLINGGDDHIISTVDSTKEEINNTVNENPVKEQIDNEEMLKQDIKASPLVPLSERLDKYKVDNTISLEDLLLEISENKITKIRIYEIKKENKSDIQTYRYGALHIDTEGELSIIGDINTINIPDSIIIANMKYFNPITVGILVGLIFLVLILIYYYKGDVLN